MIFRFFSHPQTFPESLRDPIESFYVGAFWVSIALLLENISQYGVPYCGPWLRKTLEILFWFYFASILLVAIFQYYSIFVNQNLRISDMTPAWILPIYPLLVTGSLAGILVAHQPIHAAASVSQIVSFAVDLDSSVLQSHPEKDCFEVQLFNKIIDTKFCRSG